MRLARYAPARRSLFTLPLFDDSFHRLWSGESAVDNETSWTPRVDVHEKEDHYLIEADLPGVSKEDIKLEVDKRALTISGERKSEEKEENDGYTRVERYFGKFERSFTLTENIKTEKIDAEYKEGTLKVKLPKPEEQKPKQIGIKVK